MSASSSRERRSSREEGLTVETLFTLTTLRHIGLFAVSSCLTTAVSLTQPLSQNARGGYDYSPQAAVLLSEVIKALASTLMLLYEAVVRRQRTTPPPADEPPLVASDPLRQVAYYSVPATLWFINNNITFYVVRSITPATNQGIGQLKVVFTTGLMYALLSRRFNAQQLFALAVLTVALVMMAADEGVRRQREREEAAAAQPQPQWAVIALMAAAVNRSSSGGAVAPSDEPISPVLAILLSVTTAFLGSLAGVFNEKYLKELRSSLFFQNCIAYAWGSVFNFAFLYLSTSSREATGRAGLLGGFNSWTFAYVAFVASMGLSVSFILKFQDNIARILSTATSLSLTLFLSVPVLGAAVSGVAVAAVALITLALFGYYDGAERQRNAEAEERAGASSAEQGKEEALISKRRTEQTPLVAR